MTWEVNESMAFLDTYRQRVALLIRTIPFVAREQAFALKVWTGVQKGPR